MIKLQKTSSSQTITFIPRFYSSLGTNDYNVKIVSEDEGNTVFSDDVSSFTEVDYYRTFSGTFSFNEDTFYILTIKKTSTNQILYRDKIFVTNQTATYSINNAEYSFKSESATEDQFKMYE